MHPIIIRKRNFILASLLSLSSSVALAIDLGDIEVESEPGEPLEATIDIADADADPSKIEVSLADDDEFSKAVIALTPEVRDLELVKVQSEDGKLKIRLRSKLPIEEEVVHFMVAVRTPDGRVVREYVVIEEGEVYATHTQPSIVELAIQESEIGLPLPYIALREEGEEDEDESEESEELEETSILVKEQAPTHFASVVHQSHYRVKPGDSLWIIAKRVQGNTPNASFYQVMAALYQMNPKAFINGNVNLLRSGATLTVPNAKTIANLDKSASIQQIKAQMAAFNKPVTSAAAAEAAEATAEAEATAKAKGKAAELKILTPTNTEQEKLTDQQISENLALIGEELEQVHVKNEDLLERIAALQTQIMTLQELLTLRESEQKLIKAGVEKPAHAEKAKQATLTGTVSPAAIALEKPPETPVAPAIPPEQAPAEIAVPEQFASQKAQPETISEIPVMPKSMKEAQPPTEKPMAPAEIAHKEAPSAQKAAPSSLKSWLNYGILALLVLGAAYAFISMSRRKKARQEGIAEQEHKAVEEPKAAEHKAVEEEKKPEPAVSKTEESPDEGDKVSSKLELAKAYYDLGDTDGAVVLLQEVLWEGNAEQRQAAQEWLDKIDAEKKI